MGKDDVLEVFRAEAVCAQALLEEPTLARVVLHRVPVEGMFPVALEIRAHSGVYEDAALWVFDDVCVNWMVKPTTYVLRPRSPKQLLRMAGECEFVVQARATAFKDM